MLVLISEKEEGIASASVHCASDCVEEKKYLKANSSRVIVDFFIKGANVGRLRFVHLDIHFRFTTLRFTGEDYVALKKALRLRLRISIDRYRKLFSGCTKEKLRH